MAINLSDWAPMPPNEGPPLPEFLGIYWPWYKPPTIPVTPTPTGGAASFTVGVINLPSGATSWNCAFQDPATGIYYQATNRPLTASFTLAGPSEVNDFSVPVSAGVLSISAFGAVTGTESETNLPPQLVNYQINITVADGGAYTFDFSNQNFS